MPWTKIHIHIIPQNECQTIFISYPLTDTFLWYLNYHVYRVFIPISINDIICIIGQDSRLRGGGGLLEDLAAGLECLYLSDLRYGYCQSALRFVLPCLDPGRYSVEEWNRAAAYIMGTECAYPDSAKAREALVAFSREKAENGIYRSREEWYGNR